jgi:hypothetical protein
MSDPLPDPLPGDHEESDEPPAAKVEAARLKEKLRRTLARAQAGFDGPLPEYDRLLDLKAALKQADALADEAAAAQGLNLDVPSDTRFGACPECVAEAPPGMKHETHIVNVGRNHWRYCQRHKVKWRIGANLFSSWKEETEEEWQRNAEMLASFDELKTDP